MFGGRLGWAEVLIIVLVLLVIFGPSKLPKLGKSIGESLREFKQSMKGLSGEDEASAEQKEAGKKG
jgi:sec-independent protein translocase protein TatA